MVGLTHEIFLGKFKEIQLKASLIFNGSNDIIIDQYKII